LAAAEDIHGAYQETKEFKEFLKALAKVCRFCVWDYAPWSEEATVASAYEFTCDMSLEEMFKVLNEKGSWQWTMHDSHWYGDYLNCRPEEGIRVRIHHPAEFNGGITQDPKDLDPKDRYTALFTIESKAATRGLHDDAVDQIFRELLVHLHARNLREIEYYD
jgi:hypothetical protein